MGHCATTMSAISTQQLLVSPAEFLAGEVAASCKHEYLNGVVYAMAGGTFAHSAVAVNILTALRSRLRGKPCRPMNSDMLIHLRHGADERYYYPDVSVVCHPVQAGARSVDNPTVVFEVLSPGTERFDSGEKKDAYLRCETLQAYVLVHSERVEVTIHTRRGDGWDATRYNENTDTLPLPCIQCELPLAEIYEE
jgi:Uma2 family endonuclease